MNRNTLPPAASEPEGLDGPRAGAGPGFGRRRARDRRGGTDPSAVTSPDIAKVQRRLKLCQWAVPAMTGGIAVLNAVHGERQRPQQQLPGILATPARLLGLTGTPRSARRPALGAVGLRSRPGGPGYERRQPARLRAGSPGSVAASGRYRGGSLASASRQLRTCGARCPYPGKDCGRLADAGMRHSPPRRRRTVTSTDWGNDEPRSEGSSNGHAVEVQSEALSA